MNDGPFTFLVHASDNGQRLDIVLSRHLSGCSRSMASLLIRTQCVRVGGNTAKPGYRVKADDEITGHIPPPEPLDCRPEPIDIDILFEDEHLIVLNKQPGIVVHPAPGNRSGTLVNALLHHCPGLGGIGNVIRPGIVHRLDKGTSGALVVAKTDPAHRSLSEQFKSRTVRKIYLALVYGEPRAESGAIDLPIGRHPVDRKRMSTIGRSGRKALSLWQVRERFSGSALLGVEIKTGRTHQIRVHCAALGFPVVGDTVYGGRKRAAGRFPGKAGDTLLASVPRQMLHARSLTISHPISGEQMVFEASLPRDMEELLDQLRSECLIS